MLEAVRNRRVTWLQTDTSRSSRVSRSPAGGVTCSPALRLVENVEKGDFNPLFVIF